MALGVRNICHLSAALLASLFHLFGIILLYRMTIEKSNQTLLIINLAGTELLYCLYEFAYVLLKVVSVDKPPALVTIDWIVALSFLIANKLMMLYLILDRFAEIYFHMKYPLFFTKARVIKILSVLWVFSIVYGTVIAVLTIWSNGFKNPYIEKSNYIQSYNYFTLVVDATITVVAVGTYLCFYSKVSSIIKRTKSEEKQRNQGMDRKQNRKFLIPFLMIATYLVFNVSSTVLFTVRR